MVVEAPKGEAVVCPFYTWKAGEAGDGTYGMAAGDTRAGTRPRPAWFGFSRAWP
jgi:hypothetical protein